MSRIASRVAPRWLRFTKAGLDPRETSLNFGIFGAEPWTNAMRSEIERDFALDATGIDGLSEVIGPGVALECVATKNGLHVWEDHVLTEVIDPGTGEVLPNGETGELVVTSLTKEAFPIIRYRPREPVPNGLRPCLVGRRTLPPSTANPGRVPQI